MKKTTSCFAALQLMLLLPSLGHADEYPSFTELTREVRDRMETADRYLRSREVELHRRLRILEGLARGGEALATRGSVAGDDAAHDAIAAARELAEQEPALDDGVFQALDECAEALDRLVPGESSHGRSARFHAAMLQLERQTAAGIGQYVFEAERFRELGAGIDKISAERADAAAQALMRLYSVHSSALKARQFE